MAVTAEDQVDPPNCRKTPATLAQGFFIAVLAVDRLRQLSDKAGASGLEGVAKMCAYLKDVADFATFEAVRRLMGWTALPASDFVAIPSPGPVSQASIQIEAVGFSTS